MYKLILDTSNQYLAVAIYKDDERVEKIQEYGSMRQSENAIPYLSQVLDRQHISLLDIDEMIITKGPGSYTGERVGMTIAKTLSVISPVKIKVISSLAAYAGMHKCVSVIDARSKKVFVCAYDKGEPLMEEQILPISDFDKFMEDYKDYEVVGYGSLVGREDKEVDLIDNIYQLSKKVKPVENVDALVPSYLKDIEAKKLCA